jgi:putative ABC transport system permease protein
MFRNYLAAALRNLGRNRLYAGVTILGLTIAFASAILIGLYLRHELTYDQFIPGHERVFIINQQSASNGKPNREMDSSSALLAGDLKSHFPQIEVIARIANSGFPPTIRQGDASFSEQNFIWADPDFFKAMPLPAVAGDLAHALEAPDAVVLTVAASRKFFGKDAPLGEMLQVNGHPMRVAAVIRDLPSNTHLSGEVFASSRSAFSQLKLLDKAGYTANANFTYVRLKRGVSAEAMKAPMRDFTDHHILPILQRIDPDTRFQSASINLKPITSIHLHPSQSGDMKVGADIKVLTGLGVIGGLIVVVAAINFVTLMTARAARRSVEVGVRKALGAARLDLVAQFMGEAAIYVTVALVLAVSLAELLLPAVNAALQRKMSFDYLTDPGLFAALLGVALVVALLAGLYPALVLSSFRPSTVLKGGPVAMGPSGAIVRHALVIAQFAVLVALILSTTTIFRQTMFALRDATRMNKDGVVMLFASPCTDTLRDAIAAVPGVRSAACASPAAVGLSSSVEMVNFQGRKVMLQYVPIDFGYFETYGVKPVAGRLLRRGQPGDDGALLTAETPPPILINEAAVREFGLKSAQAAIGRPITWSFNRAISMSSLDAGPAPYRTSAIVGVVPDVTFRSVRQAVDPTFYYVGAKTDVLNSVVLNVRLDPTREKEAISRIALVWRQVSRGQPLQQYYADQFLVRLYMDSIIQGGFIAVCAIIAVSIACLGLFALSAFTAERRTKEIGVRKAMGASSGDILKLLLWSFTKPVLWANLIAWPVAFFAMRWWLAGFAYHVDVAPWTFVAAAAAALIIAWSTVLLHALSVARSKPAAALRYE